MLATRQERRHMHTAWASVVGCLWLTMVVCAYAQNSPQCGGKSSSAPVMGSALGEPHLVVAVEGLTRRGDFL